jgi:hypothetical protein
VRKAWQKSNEAQPYNSFILSIVEKPWHLARAFFVCVSPCCWQCSAPGIAAPKRLASFLVCVLLALTIEAPVKVAFLLLMHTLDLDYVRLTYRPDLHVLFLRWTRPVSSAEHQAGYQAALTLARQMQVGHWLIDLRTRGLASAEDFRWVLVDFRNELAAALPTLDRRLAYFVTPYHATLIEERLQEAEASSALVPNHQTTIHTFTEERFAQQWLADGQL